MIKDKEFWKKYRQTNKERIKANRKKYLSNTKEINKQIRDEDRIKIIQSNPFYEDTEN